MALLENSAFYFQTLQKKKYNVIPFLGANLQQYSPRVKNHKLAFHKTKFQALRN